MKSKKLKVKRLTYHTMRQPFHFSFFTFHFSLFYRITSFLTLVWPSLPMLTK